MAPRTSAFQLSVRETTRNDGYNGFVCGGRLISATDDVLNAVLISTTKSIMTNSLENAIICSSPTQPPLFDIHLESVQELTVSKSRRFHISATKMKDRRWVKVADIQVSD
jgi:hypothetical protein